MKVTICDRCATQIKGTARAVEGKDLCSDCFGLWGTEFAAFKEKFFSPLKQDLLFGVLPKRMVLMGGLALVGILLLLVVLRI
jgi:hypothetical protein